MCQHCSVFPLTHFYFQESSSTLYQLIQYEWSSGKPASICHSLLCQNVQCSAWECSSDNNVLCQHYWVRKNSLPIPSQLPAILGCYVLFIFAVISHNWLHSRIKFISGFKTTFIRKLGNWRWKKAEE